MYSEPAALHQAREGDRATEYPCFSRAGRLQTSVPTYVSIQTSSRARDVFCSGAAASRSSQVSLRFAHLQNRQAPQDVCCVKSELVTIERVSAQREPPFFLPARTGHRRLPLTRLDCPALTPAAIKQGVAAKANGTASAVNSCNKHTVVQNQNLSGADSFCSLNCNVSAMRLTALPSPASRFPLLGPVGQLCHQQA